MAGVYFSTGLICLWTAIKVPKAVWLAYLIPELVLPIVIVVAKSLRP